MGVGFLRAVREPTSAPAEALKLTFTHILRSVADGLAEPIVEAASCGSAPPSRPYEGMGRGRGGR